MEKKREGVRIISKNISIFVEAKAQNPKTFITMKKHLLGMLAILAFVATSCNPDKKETPAPDEKEEVGSNNNPTDRIEPHAANEGIYEEGR
jgi:hypothetical protein